MNKTPKQSIFKIISLTKNQPIFLYRNIQKFKGSLGEGLGMAVDSARSSPVRKFKNVKEEMEKIASKLNIHRENSRMAYLEKRSESCEISQKIKRKTEIRADSSQSKEKMQKTIKEYLRLAYKRAEMEKRSRGYKLPALVNSPHTENYSKSQESGDEYGRCGGKNGRHQLKNLSNLRRVVRKGRAFDLSNQKPQEQVYDLFNPELISGWEDYQISDDF